MSPMNAGLAPLFAICYATFRARSPHFLASTCVRHCNPPFEKLFIFSPCRLHTLQFGDVFHSSFVPCCRWFFFFFLSTRLCRAAAAVMDGEQSGLLPLPPCCSPQRGLLNTGCGGSPLCPWLPGLVCLPPQRAYIKPLSFDCRFV